MQQHKHRCGHAHSHDDGDALNNDSAPDWYNQPCTPELSRNQGLVCWDEQWIADPDRTVPAAGEPCMHPDEVYGTLIGVGTPPQWSGPDQTARIGTPCAQEGIQAPMVGNKA